MSAAVHEQLVGARFRSVAAASNARGIGSPDRSEVLRLGDSFRVRACPATTYQLGRRLVAPVPSVIHGLEVTFAVLAEFHTATRRWAAAATLALNARGTDRGCAAAPDVDVDRPTNVRDASRITTELRRLLDIPRLGIAAGRCARWPLLRQSLRPRRATTVSSWGSSAGAVVSVGAVAPVLTGSARLSRAPETSMRTRPEGSVSPSPTRRTASAIAAAPSTTSPASCGQVDSVTLDLDHRRCALGGGARHVEMTEHVRDLFAGTHARQRFARVHSRRSGRAGSGGRGRGRNARRPPGRDRSSPSAPEVPSRPGLLAHDGLHVERIAFLHHDIESVEEDSLTVSSVRPAVNTRTFRYGSSSAIRRAASVGLVHAEVQHSGRHAVEVGQLKGVEVGQP